MSDAPAVKKKFSEKGLEFIDWLLGRYPDKQAALLPVLRLAEEEFGNIDNDSVMLVAETLELSPGYVWGVLTFYTTTAGRATANTCCRSAAPCPARSGGAGISSTVSRRSLGSRRARPQRTASSR